MSNQSLTIESVKSNSITGVPSVVKWAHFQMSYGKML